MWLHGGEFLEQLQLDREKGPKQGNYAGRCCLARVWAVSVGGSRRGPWLVAPLSSSSLASLMWSLDCVCIPCFLEAVCLENQTKAGRKSKGSHRAGGATWQCLACHVPAISANGNNSFNSFQKSWPHAQSLLLLPYVTERTCCRLSGWRKWFPSICFILKKYSGTPD